MHERQEAIDLLAGLTDSASRKLISDWMGRVESNQCPPEIQIEVLEAAAKSSDASLVKRQKSFVDKLAREGAGSQYSECLVGGDPVRGKQIFQTNDTLACRRCHSVKPNETLVGPNLSNVGAQRKSAEILESIISPNAKICEGFESTVLELDSGKVVVGIVRHEDRTKIELVDANAKTIVIDAASVENRVKGKSAMPENLMQQMSRRELRDIVAFLSQLHNPISASEATPPTRK
jgi:quinoprotein glucose dehydrogenase